ncbi:hypothetical protein [Sphaerisporangium corydalis]|uniref:Uncharacterized protein n=1 Tax=Sphaerisporangium corydalis TaxID=1441875 RepID=A0ABV9EMS9_9ACTN|nr:hypothetical protein [Sphaerisporangium corydalis]
MDRDGTPRSFEEDPLKQTGPLPLGIDWDNESGRPDGDVLSDGWRPGHDPAQDPGDGSVEFDPPDRARLRDDDGPDHLDPHLDETQLDGGDYEDYERPEGYARPDEDHWDPDADVPAEERRGFLGSGWTGENDPEEEKRSQNRRLVLALVAIVVLAVAGGWIVSSSVGSKSEAACAKPAGCAPAGGQDALPTGDPSAAPTGDEQVTEPTAEPSETTASPSESATPEPTSSRGRVPQEPSARPTPTRTRVRSPQPTPRSSNRSQEPDDPEIEDDPTPKPSATPTPPPTTQAPQPAPSPTKTKSTGLLDWLF